MAAEVGFAHSLDKSIIYFSLSLRAAEEQVRVSIILQSIRCSPCPATVLHSRKAQRLGLATFTTVILN